MNLKKTLTAIVSLLMVVVFAKVNKSDTIEVQVIRNMPQVDTTKVINFGFIDEADVRKELAEKGNLKTLEEIKPIDSKNAKLTVEVKEAKKEKVKLVKKKKSSLKKVYKTKARASWYGPGFQGKLTANGEIYNMNKLTAAHKNLKFGTKVKVTNLDNGKTTIVKINDRGPYIRGREIDLSKKAFTSIASINKGVLNVKLEILK